MTRSNKANDKITVALRKIALRFPEAEEGIACKGTALECATFKARKKAYLFLCAIEIKVKLGDSLGEAEEYETKDAGCCKVGAHGWVAVYLANEHTPPLDVLERWIDESYRLLAPKQLVETLGKAKSAKTIKRPARSGMKKA